MKILIAPNAFKESLSAAEAARAIAQGLRRAGRSVNEAALELIELPIADGGDGTAEVFRQAYRGRRVEAEVTGPLGEPVRASYALLTENGRKTAVIEFASASGLWRVPPVKRNPMKTTSRGTGELIMHALEREARKVILTFGGSATVDGALGILHGLGFTLLDRQARRVPDNGGGLEKINKVLPPVDSKRLDQVEWVALVDVDNVLTGDRGAAAIFGPQKGATPAMVQRLDQGLANLAEIIRRDFGRDVTRIKGGGAAGGASAAIAGVLGAKVVQGARWILDALKFNEKLNGADWLITGEGKLDSQSLLGKAPVEAARRARKMGIPVIGLAGAVDINDNALQKAGFTAKFSICVEPCSLESAIKNAGLLLARQAEQAGRLIFRNH